MKTMAQVDEALSKRYDGPLQQVQGRDYIPWDEAMRHLINIFGNDGLDVGIREVRLESVPNQDGKSSSYGYMSIVTLTFKTSDTQPFTRDALGFSEISYTNAGKPQMDMAIKGAVSGGIPRGTVLLGDGGGLFLYSEGKAKAAKGTTTPSVDRTTVQAATTRKEGLSSKQLDVLRNKKLPEGLITALDTMQDWKQRKDIFSEIIYMDKAQAVEALKRHGIEEEEELPF